MIRRAKRNVNYVILSKTGLEDVRLSWKAKGLLAYLLGKPDNWTVIAEFLVTQSTDGRTAVLSGLKELEEFGYLVRTKLRNEDGTFQPDSIVYDEPEAGFQTTDEHTTDKLTTDKPTLIRKDRISNELISNEETSNELTTPRTRKRDAANPMTQPILEAYQEAVGYALPSYGREAKAAKTLAERGYMPADVIAAYQAIKNQPFWASKFVSLTVVLQEIQELANYAKKGGDINQVSKKPQQRTLEEIAASAFAKMDEVESRRRGDG